ncbi:MAG: TetR/AcrR family transcriptional regulator [Leptospiraceae bacterium]|nr:TetR/AcrR family transcriptional regulator [Leptospiraceae bacterium]
MSTQVDNETLPDTDLSARDRILDAARRAFSQNGYFGTSIRQISNLCGLKQPSIYHHFESKENLFRSALISSHTEMMNYINSRTGKEADLAQDVEKVYMAYASFHQERPGALHLLGNLIYSAPEGLRDEYAEAYGPEMTSPVEQVFAKWDAEGKFEELKICINHTLTAFLIELSVREKGREDEILSQTMRAVRYVLRLSGLAK